MQGVSPWDNNTHDVKKRLNKGKQTIFVAADPLRTFPGLMHLHLSQDLFNRLTLCVSVGCWALGRAGGDGKQRKVLKAQK